MISRAERTTISDGHGTRCPGTPPQYFPVRREFLSHGTSETRYFPDLETPPVPITRLQFRREEKGGGGGGKDPQIVSLFPPEDPQIVTTMKVMALHLAVSMSVVESRTHKQKVGT
jgi:hypothetical protein